MLAELLTGLGEALVNLHDGLSSSFCSVLLPPSIMVSASGEPTTWKGDGGSWHGRASRLDMLVREGLSEKVTFELTPGGERVNCARGTVF